MSKATQEAFDILFKETSTDDENVFNITEKTITSFCRKPFGLTVIQYGDDYYITIDEVDTYDLIEYYIPVPIMLASDLIDRGVLLPAGHLSDIPKYYARPYLGDKEFNDRRTDDAMVKINNDYYLCRTCDCRSCRK